MSVNIVVPSFGESITEGTVAQWLKKDGDYVNKDDILLEVESEKATQGIPSPASGVLHPRAKEGDKVEVGGIIGSVDDTAKAKNERSETASAPKPASERREPAGSEPKLSPAARRAAAED